MDSGAGGQTQVLCKSDLQPSQLSFQLESTFLESTFFGQSLSLNLKLANELDRLGSKRQGSTCL